MRVLPPADVMATLAVAVIPADTMAADAASRLAIGNPDSDDQDGGESKNRGLQVARDSPKNPHHDPILYPGRGAQCR